MSKRTKPAKPTTPTTPATPAVITSKTIYAALNGSDSAAGTSGAPVRTIAKALKLAGAGDKVVVREGAYPEVVRVTQSGTSDKPIEILAEDNGKAIIKGTGSPLDTDLVTIAASYIRFRGFGVQDASRSGIAVWKGNDIVLSENIVNGSRRAGIWAGGDGLGQSKQLQILGNTVMNNCLENKARNWNGGWPRAIAVDVSAGVTISANLVARNYGEGIGLLSTPATKVLENVVFDNYSVDIYLDNAPQSQINGNLIFSTGDKEFYRFDKPAWGVLIANEDTQFHMDSKDINVTGNTLIGSGNAIYAGPDVYSKTVLTNCTLNPNTVKASMARADLVAMISRMVKVPADFVTSMNWPTTLPKLA